MFYVNTRFRKSNFLIINIHEYIWYRHWSRDLTVNSYTNAFYDKSFNYLSNIGALIYCLSFIISNFAIGH